MESLNNENKSLKNEVAKLNNENINLKDEVAKLNNENKKLKDEVIIKLNDKIQTFTKKNNLK